MPTSSSKVSSFEYHLEGVIVIDSSNRAEAKFAEVVISGSYHWHDDRRSKYGRVVAPLTGDKITGTFIGKNSNYGLITSRVDVIRITSVTIDEQIEALEGKRAGDKTAAVGACPSAGIITNLRINCRHKNRIARC